MRVFLTGGTGFIGGHVAKALRDRGDDVVAFVRSSARATALFGMGCEIVEGQLSDRISIDRAVVGCESAFHLAGRFEVGIAKEAGPAMQDVNVGGTRRVIDSCIEAGVGRIVYASSVVVFGNTRGAIVDETFTRDPTEGFVSCYDESKYRAHILAVQRARDGAPIVMVQPGSAYGPGDHFEVGREILLAAQGRLPALMLADVGLNMTYVTDIADAFILAHDRGEIGESYVVGGENVRLRDVLARSAALTGKSPPKWEIPTSVLKAVAPLGPMVGPRMGYPPNFRELIKAADKVTYWANDAKAREKLGYSPRDLQTGLRATLEAAGIPLVDV